MKRILPKLVIAPTMEKLETAVADLVEEEGWSAEVGTMGIRQSPGSQLMSNSQDTQVDYFMWVTKQIS